VLSFTPPPSRSKPGERAPGTHMIGTKSAPEPVWTLWREESNTDPSIRQPVACSLFSMSYPGSKQNGEDRNTQEKDCPCDQLRGTS
jgi:hypothetical protein